MYPKIQALLHRTQEFVVLIRDSSGGLFGGVIVGCGGPFPSHEYTGSGQSFVFKQEGAKLEFSSWTGLNDYYAVFGREEFGMGGDGFAFCLEADLCKGTSGPSRTFDSPQLASTEVFDCVEFEMWGLFPSAVLQRRMRTEL